MSKATRRRRRYIKYAAYTAGAIGAALLAKKLAGGLFKKGSSPDVTDESENLPPEEGGFSDTSEQGVAQMGMMGGGNTMLWVAAGAVVLLMLWKK